MFEVGKIYREKNYIHLRNAFKVLDIVTNTAAHPGRRVLIIEYLTDNGGHWCGEISGSLLNDPWIDDSLNYEEIERRCD